MNHGDHKRTAKICCNCRQEARRLNCGRCSACYWYWRSHDGVERPAHLFQKYCSRCGRSPTHAKGLCMSCYRYRRTTGRPRPMHLCDRNAACCRNPNCGKPLSLVPASKAGYCVPCYSYRYRTGQQRPTSLTGGPGPWCECGQPATRQHSIVLLPRRVVALDLCEACYRLETSPG